jgi:hypothetical protein
MDILNSSKEWPWLYSQGTECLATVCQSVPKGSLSTSIDTATYTNIDWDSIYLTDKKTGQRELSLNLKRIDYDEWVTKYREQDLLFAEDNQGQPEYVFMHPNKELIGLTPVPDKEYFITYNAWNVPTFLTNPDDKLPFADRWYTVLIARARYYLWLFRENDRQAAFAKGDYEMGLREMQRELLGQQVTHVRAV